MNLAPLPLFLVLLSGLCWTLVYIRMLVQTKAREGRAGPVGEA